MHTLVEFLQHGRDNLPNPFEQSARRRGYTWRRGWSHVERGVFGGSVDAWERELLISDMIDSAVEFSLGI